MEKSVPVYRNGSVVSSLSNAFSGSLRETRLTAILGYLISLKSEPFLDLFGIGGSIDEINIEYKEESGRSDIQIITHNGVAVIEAKVDCIDPISQIDRYKAKWYILLTNYQSVYKDSVKNVKYTTWHDIYNTCMVLSNSNDYRIKFISGDMMNYLREHKMVKSNSSVEIYAREINEEFTLSLFLHGQMYGCDYEPGSSLSEAAYFAPHFGNNIANLHPGITLGISYIARIENIDITDSKAGLVDIIKKHRGKAWLNSHKHLIDPIIKTWDWASMKKRNFIFLDEPRLVFNPSVKKELLQKGKGWLSKKYFTFDELYKAWSGKPIF